MSFNQLNIAGRSAAGGVRGSILVKAEDLCQTGNDPCVLWSTACSSTSLSACTCTGTEALLGGSAYLLRSTREGGPELTERCGGVLGDVLGFDRGRISRRGWQAGTQPGRLLISPHTAAPAWPPHHPNP